MNGEGLTIIGKRIVGKVAQWHVPTDLPGQTWCGRQLNGITQTRKVIEPPYNLCRDCMTALSHKRPTTRRWRRTA